MEGLVQKQSEGGPMARCQLIVARSGLNVISIGHRGPPLLGAVYHCGSDVTVHSEAIWGVMIALVFFAIFEPYDENKS